MPALTIRELMDSVRAKKVTHGLTKRDIAIQVLILMELWRERFPNDSMPREMNRVMREMR